MSYSISKLDNLFSSKGFVPNNYYILDGFYKMVEIINFKTATSLVVVISDKYKIAARGGKHEFNLIKKNVTGDMLNSIVDEATLRSSYQEIDHISKALESEEKMHEIYDKPISLKGEEDKSMEKFASNIRQMKRFKLCVRNIPYKFLLIDDDCMCLLNNDSEIETYYITDYKIKKRKLFITTMLENFFEVDDIEQSVNTISEQFYNILQENQKTETSKIQGMIDAKRNIATQSKKILQMKQQLLDSIKSLKQQHSALMNKQNELMRKNKDSKLQGTVEMNVRNLEIAKIDEKQRDIIKNIVDSRKQLDELCLVVDNILFDNMVMLTRITSNFKILERLKV